MDHMKYGTMQNRLSKALCLAWFSELSRHRALQRLQLLRDPNIWPRREPSCYPKDIAKHKLAARKKISLHTSSPVDQRLLLIACRRCLSMTFSRSTISW
jgi:hypothetical protein